MVIHPSGYAAFQPSTVWPLRAPKLVCRLMFTGWWIWSPDNGPPGTHPQQWLSKLPDSRSGGQHVSSCR